MSKYIVIYKYIYTKEVAHPPIKNWTTPSTKTESYDGFGLSEFDDYQRAYEYATQKNGYVLETIQPAKVEPAH